MPFYEYTARTSEGEREKGTEDAASRQAALASLESRGLTPIAIKESTSGATARKTKESSWSIKLDYKRNPRMKMREMLLFTQELSDLLASGMKLGRCLHTLSARETTPGQDKITKDLRDKVVQGTDLSEALADYPQTFPELYINMVRAGEASGALSESLEGLCHHYERLQDARGKVLGALLYPAIVLGMGAIALTILMVFVVPRFASIFADLGATLPLMTRILIGSSKWLLQYGLFLLMAVVVGLIIFRRAVRTKKGRLWWHGLKLKIPLVKGLVSASAYSNFARTLGTLISNGVPILQALSIVEDTVGNAVLGREIHAARERVTDGSSVSGPLAAAGCFPRTLTDMLAVGEESGDLPGSLKHIGRRYEQQLDQSVKIFTTVLEPLCILLVALVVGFVAISILMAVFDLTSGLQV